MKKFLFILIIGSIFVHTYAQTIPTDGLVGYWPFNGNANDESGNGNDGTLNGPSLTSDRFGNTNRAFYFDGIDDYINCGYAPSVLNLNNLTISAWVYYEGHPGYNQDVILSTLGSAISGGYQIHLENWERKIMFHYRDSILPHHFAKTLSTIEINKWYHFITVFNNDESEIHISVYLDGKLENSVIDSVPIYYGHTDNLRIGANRDLSAQRFFKGKIDDIRIYSRGLNDSEVLALFDVVPNLVEISKRKNQPLMS